MNIVKQNPYRILGLLGNSSERVIQKQIGTIKAFARVGKMKTTAYDLDFIGRPSRTIDDIQLAASSIEQAKKKLHYSLFWFIQNNPIDEVALNHVNQNPEKATEIWQKALKDGITAKNFSAYLNLSSLYLALSIIGEQLSIDDLQQAIYLKGQLINSNNLNVLSEEVAGNGLTLSSDNINRAFVDEILISLNPFLNKENGINTNELIALFGSFPESTRKYLASKFTEIPLANIENLIDNNSSKRKSNPRDAEEYGEELYRQTKSDISTLKKMLGKENVQYQLIANKLANEILQCSIDFFNTHREEGEGFDPGDDALRIVQYAKSIDVTGQTQNRIDESMDFIENWVDEKPLREREEIANKDLEYITTRLEHFQNQDNNIESVKRLVLACKPKLSNLKNILGANDDLFINVSSAIVQNALNRIIFLVNAMQSRTQYVKVEISSFKNIISEALEVLNMMSVLDMNDETRSRFSANKNSISNINTQIRTLENKANSYSNSYSRAASTTNNKSNEGCYIATMAYGSYEHPQVMKLRRFRDEVLSKTIQGRISIKFYYATSPYLVSLLKNQTNINHYIRKLLDQIIKHIQ